MANPNLIKSSYLIDVVKHRWHYLLISIVILIPCIVAMFYLMFTQPNHAPVKLGIDFTGGTILQYGVNNSITPDQISKIRSELEQNGVSNPIIQNMSNTGTDKQIKNIISIKTRFMGEKNNDRIDKITMVLSQNTDAPQLISTTSVGPTLGKELLKNSLAALLLAFLGIVIYISFRFQADYAIIALAALFHDALFVVGVFSILGILYNVQVDSLFITAILTVVGFSVHDTIVVFDRIRENNRFLAKKYTSGEIINASVNQTLARSVNTSLTTLLTLIALYFFGGETTKDFVLAMILGIIAGTYSSIFFASVLLAWDKEIKAKKANA